MNIYFFDTSALAKRYVFEKGSGWVHAIFSVSAPPLVFVSLLSSVEMVSLLARLQRHKQLSIDHFERLRDTFLVHLRQDYRVLALTEAIVTRAQNFTHTHGLQSLDALQLASASYLQTALGQTLSFAAGDVRLLAAAEAEGLPIENPEYPRSQSGSF